jgi:hypothetical protein
VGPLNANLDAYIKKEDEKIKERKEVAELIKKEFGLDD